MASVRHYSALLPPADAGKGLIRGETSSEARHHGALKDIQVAAVRELP